MKSCTRTASRHAAVVISRPFEPSPALAGGGGADAVASATIESRKHPRGWAGAPYLLAHGIDVAAITEPTVIFEGNALDAAAGFPANVNVAAALALAGIGPQRTTVRLWADPTVDRNIHTIKVEAAAARLTMTVENVPSETNPKTGKLTPLSVLACLRGLTSTLKVGS